MSFHDSMFQKVPFIYYWCRATNNMLLWSAYRCRMEDIVSRIPRAYPSQYSVLALAPTLGFGTSFSVKLSAISSLDLFSFLSTASLLSTLGSFTRLARLSTVSTFSLLTFLHTSPLTKIGLIDHTALQKQIHVIL